MSKTGLKIFEEPEFKSASRLDKFRMCLLELKFEELLTGQEYEHWQRIQMVFALCFKQYDHTKAIRVIRNQVAGADAYNTAKRLYDDMCEVYGPIQRRNKEMARAILIQRLWSLGVRLEQRGDLVEAGEMFEKAGKFEGLDKFEAVDFDPADIEIPPPNITNDPKWANAEDIEYEDGEEEAPDDEEEED